MIMLLLSNDSASSAAVADLLHSSLITMVESCTSCTRYEIFVNKLQRYICSTLNPFMAAWVLGCSLLDVDVIRVMSCVWCCRAEHVLTMILL